MNRHFAPGPGGSEKENASLSSSSAGLPVAVAHFYDGLRTGSVGQVLEAFSPDYRVHEGLGGARQVERGDLRAFFEGLARAFGDFNELTHDEVLPASGGVTVRWSASCQRATAFPVMYSGVDTFELADDGRIARLDGYFALEHLYAVSSSSYQA